MVILKVCCAEQWADALHQWLGITDDCVHMVTKGKDCQLEGKKFQFLITSYNFVPKLKDQLQELGPQVMVLDEAHSIKASKVPQAQSSSAVCMFAFLPGHASSASVILGVQAHRFTDEWRQCCYQRPIIHQILHHSQSEACKPVCCRACALRRQSPC